MPSPTLSRKRTHAAVSAALPPQPLADQPLPLDLASLPLLLTPAFVAEQIGVTPRAIRGWTSAGLILTRRIGVLVRIPRDELGRILRDGLPSIKAGARLVAQQKNGNGGLQ